MRFLPSYGGRASFNGITATVFSGSSFVGQNVIARLGKLGTQIVIAYRGSRYTEEKLKTTGDLGQIYFARFNLKDDNSLHEAMRHSDVVVNCIGKENETSNFTFNDVHVDGPRRMARIAREIGVKKFIHISALNASPNPSPCVLKKGSQFYKSKYFGELAVREEFPEAIIFRPSDVVGERDEFINHYTSLQRSCYTRTLPLYDYYDGVEKQPVWIKDLVSGIEKAIYNESANGKTIQAVGPYRYDFYELIEYIRACAGQGQKHDYYRISNMRYSLILRACIAFVEKFHKYPPLTWERVERDSTSDFVDPKLPTLKDLGVELTDLEPQIKSLADYRPKFGRYEIPYHELPQIDTPTKLNLTV